MKMFAVAGGFFGVIRSQVADLFSGSECLVYFFGNAIYRKMAVKYRNGLVADDAGLHERSAIAFNPIYVYDRTVAYSKYRNGSLFLVRENLKIKTGMITGKTLRGINRVLIRCGRDIHAEGEKLCAPGAALQGPGEFRRIGSQKTAVPQGPDPKGQSEYHEETF